MAQTSGRYPIIDSKHAAGAAVVAAVGTGFVVGGWIANRFKKRKEK